MAYATQDQVLNYLQGGQQQQGADPTSAKPMGTSSGSGIVSSGSAGGSPQQGQGGQKLWTNIQSYLGANEAGQENRAKSVEQKVGGVLGQEKSAFDVKAQEAKSSAEKATAPVSSVGKDQASQLISQASSAEKGTEQYNKALDPLRGALQTQIKPQGAFSYGMSNEAQGLSQLGDQQKFGGFLSMFDKANQQGRDLSTGQRALQNQLDVQNPYLESTRQGLANKYNEFTKSLETGAQDVNKQVKDIYGNAIKNQEALRSQLESMGTQSQAEIDRAVQAHNAQTQQADTAYQNFQNQLDQSRSKAFDFSGLSGNDKAAQAASVLGKMSPQELQSLDVNKGREAFNRGDVNDPNYLFWQLMSSGGSGGNAEYAQKQAAEKKEFQDYVNSLRNAPSYEQGQLADMTNVGGVDSQVSQFNTIMDLFGKSGISRAGTAKASKYNDKIGWKA